MNLPFGGFSRICTASEIVRAVVTNRGSIADGGYSTHCPCSLSLSMRRAASARYPMPVPMLYWYHDIRPVPYFSNWAGVPPFPHPVPCFSHTHTQGMIVPCIAASLSNA